MSVVHRPRPRIWTSLLWGRRSVLQNDSWPSDGQLGRVYVNCLFLCRQAYFAKYDAVALYLSRRKYPPGLTYVEKNTFRRFCKKFAIKGLQRKINL